MPAAPAPTIAGLLEEDFLVLGVDRAQRAAQAARGEVLPHQAPQGALALGGADEGDARGGEQGGERVTEHAGSLADRRSAN